MVRLLLMVGVIAAGCGGSSGGFAGGGLGGIAGGGGASGGGGAGGGGAGGTAGSGPGVVTGARVFDGEATMLFHGPSCTAEVGAPGDRWCAFVTFSDATSDARSLFVVNVSRVVAGVAVTCGGGGGAAATDPNCLLLTPSLGRDSLEPTLHGTYFQGDTLVYYDRSLAAYAWRPGMTRGRLLAMPGAGQNVVLCTPTTRGTAVMCLVLPATQPEPDVSHADLLIGKADGANEPLLSLADTVITSTAADIGGPRFSFGFPPGADDYVAWTSRAGATGPETLKLQKAGDPASKVTVASDAHAWHVSPDGARWFWLSAVDRTGVGTLHTAPFPSGANPTPVRVDVLEYGILPADGQTVVAVTILGALVAIAQPAAATTELVLDTQVRTLLSFSAAGHVAYAKRRVGASSGDLFVKKADGTEPCAVEPTSRVPFSSVSFVPNSGAIMWARSKPGGFDGHYTRLRDCATTPIASDVVVLASIGHERALFMDTFDDTTRAGSLRTLTVGNGNTLQAGPPTLVADNADSYTISGPAPGTLLYTINTGGDSDGVYVRWFGD
jgi:hypothetical protein